MALRLRRGTDAERGTITPLSGELIYTTDTGKLYVGDGTTLGGNLVGPVAASSYDVINDLTPQLGGDLDLNGSDIIGTGNINITGTITATGSINLGDGAEDNIIVGGVITSSLTPGTSDAYDLGSAANRWRQLHVNGVAVDGHIEALSINADLIDDGSVVAFNSATGLFTGDLQGNILAGDSSIIVNSNTGEFTGNLTGNTTGYHTGDVSGSVFTNNSTLVIDGNFGSIHPNRIYTSTFLRITDETPATTNTIQMESQDQFTALQIVRNSASDISGSNLRYGQIRFGRNDSNGLLSTGIISANRDFVWIGHTTSGSVSDADIVAISNQRFGIGTVTPVATLDVQGDAVITGDVTAAAFKGTFVADDSAIIIDGTSGSLLTANIDVVGSVAGTPSVGAGDLPSVNEWLQVTVNGNTRYIPLYA